MRYKLFIFFLFLLPISLYLALSLCYPSVFKAISYYYGPETDHFDGKKFFDPIKPDPKTFVDVLKWRITRPAVTWPEQVPVKKYDQPPKQVTGADLRVSYVGHVTFLIQVAGLNILTDPVWSTRTSPFKFAGPKRVIAPGIKFVDLPKIDLVWISHNHYDHLDLATLDLLWQRDRPRIITALGNDSIIKAHNADIIAEAYDWHEQVNINEDISLHIEPMQHWSARGLFDRNKALWAALLIKTTVGNIYFVGDSGYGDGQYFKQLRAKFGDLRLALLPIGAYEPKWFMHYAHMNPEEAVQAYLDLGQPHMIPSHFDVFKLASENFGEASQQLRTAQTKYSNLSKAIKTKINILTPGEYWLVPN